MAGISEGDQPKRLKIVPNPAKTRDCRLHNDTSFSPVDEVRETSENEAYFSANFKSVCSSVLGKESPERHVFTENETKVVDLFMGLSSKNIHFPPISILMLANIQSGVQQQLYVRLFLRKHQWLRVSRLKYDLIAGDLTPILAGLVDSGLLTDGWYCTCQGV